MILVYLIPLFNASIKIRLTKIGFSTLSLLWWTWKFVRISCTAVLQLFAFRFEWRTVILWNPSKRHYKTLRILSMNGLYGVNFDSLKCFRIQRLRLNAESISGFVYSRDSLWRKARIIWIISLKSLTEIVSTFKNEMNSCLAVVTFNRANNFIENCIGYAYAYVV